MNVSRDSLPLLIPARERLARAQRAERMSPSDPNRQLEEAHLAMVYRDLALVHGVIGNAQRGYLDLVEPCVRSWCEWNADMRRYVERARQLAGRDGRPAGLEVER